jgi:hypothetical protein
VSVSHTINKGVISSSGAAPLSASYLQSGTSEVIVDTILPASSTNTLVAAAFGQGGSSSGNLVAIEIVASQPCTIKTNGTGTSEVQTITITGTPTGGTFALAFGGAITSPLAYNASAADVQAALRLLSTLGGTTVTCGGGALPGTPVTVTFGSTLANTNVAQIVSDLGTGLTGGSSPAVAVTTTTPGVPQETLTLIAGVPITWDVSVLAACPFAGAVTAWYVTSTNAVRLQARILIA